MAGEHGRDLILKYIFITMAHINECIAEGHAMFQKELPGVTVPGLWFLAD